MPLAISLTSVTYSDIIASMMYFDHQRRSAEFDPGLPGRAAADHPFRSEVLSTDSGPQGVASRY